MLLQGCEVWIVTKKLFSQMVGGGYTRMLRMVLDINQYTLQMTDSGLYESLPKTGLKLNTEENEVTSTFPSSFRVDPALSGPVVAMQGHTIRGRLKGS